ncbi:MAG TPA: amino acid aminotransferase, partial [Polyangiaceae bacterium]|nr:amino acid aminotransferase [Polyangiaceae bacterium]
MFEVLEAAPPDPILGLTEAFKKDSNPGKINLGAGVYKDARGQTPTLSSVRKAEQRVLEANPGKAYLPISGAPEFATATQRLMLGSDHKVVKEARAQTAHTPGGTGALRVAADFIKQNYPKARLWLSDPTWENHVKVFSAAGLEVLKYPYYDAASKGLAFDAMAGALSQVPATDVVLLHACCHNPSGVDPSLDQWKKIEAIRAKQGFLPFFDFAYQGFGDGLEEDAQAVRHFADHASEMLIASSYSKNFGLYNERVGALTLIGASAEAADRAFGHVKLSVRANYSNPPSHGASVVTTILNDATLRAEWEAELRQMCGRIHQMRELFVKQLAAAGIKQDFSFITKQKGMFSFSGLSRAQVDQLRERFAVYA